MGISTIEVHVYTDIEAFIQSSFMAISIPYISYFVMLAMLAVDAALHAGRLF